FLSTVITGFKIFTTNKEYLSVHTDYKSSDSGRFFSNQKHQEENFFDMYYNDLRRGHEFIQYLTTLPVILGLLGTVIGFIIMMSGIASSDVSSAGQATSLMYHLVLGMGTALYTTLAGTIAGTWTQINTIILNDSQERLMN